jgi:acetylornithine/N-succinyldiaminopimelate aminotransferase
VVLDVVLGDGFLEHVRDMSVSLKQKLAQIFDEYPDIIEEVRGEGLMIGLKCKIPNQELIEALLEERMLTVPAGDNVVRLLPPLIAQQEHIDMACERLSAACARLSAAAKQSG